MERGTSGGDVGLYVHVPFCERVCPYCDFAVLGVGRLDPGEEAAYQDALLAEWALVRGEVAGRELATVYFGGGTPGLVRPETVARLLEVFRAELELAADPEITVELNPGRLEVERARALAELGVTRVSLGVQSLDDTVLRRLGRAQSGAEARAGLEACLAAGFQSLSADLIYGAPGQDAETLLRDADALLDLGVPHVSAYALTLEPGTPFARAAEQGKLDLPDEDAVLDMSRRLRARLAAGGLEPYEISSFARPGHRSRHNQRYWLRQDVLGLGPSAASLVGARRSKNLRELGDWREALRAGQRPLVEDEVLTDDAARRETLYLGLRRREGVRRADFARAFGSAPEAFFADELADLRGRDLLCDAGGFLRLTERGFLFADDVFLGLLAPASLAQS